MEITGDPDCLVTFKKLHPHSISQGLARNPGIVATAMHCVNAIPYVCAAEPGLLTYLDLPPVAGRAAPGRGSRAADVILDRFRVVDRVAVVTGAGLGIGRGIALGLAEAGADLVLAARTRSDLEEVAGLVERPGRRALVVPTDVTDAPPLERLVDAAVAEFGRLDILVNNAGGAMPRAAMDTSEGFFERAFHFNVTAAFTLTKLAARADGRHRGRRGRGQHLVALGQHDPDQLRGLRRGQGRPRPDDPQHRARAGAPGAGERHRRGRRGHPLARRRAHRRRPAPQYLADTPMGRPGEPEDIACAVLYLVSDASSWVTGKVFEIDGGTEHPPSPCPPRRSSQPEG